MEPLVRLTSIAAPLLRDNVNTDSIIPASYMRSLSTDPGTGLFARWRYCEDGSENSGFVLNDPRFRKARILLAGANFACGSSRENAVWALDRFGIRCVIALGFSDIFRENAFKNGMLPLHLPKDAHARIVAAATHAEPLTLTIDVETRKVIMPSGETIPFELDARHQARLLSGMDEILETLEYADQIERFREQHRRRSPWLYAPTLSRAQTEQTT